MGMTKTEIIQETAEAYTSATRAVTQHGSCAYRTPEGRRCAVGRWMTEEALDVYAPLILDVVGVANREEFWGETLDAVLREEAQGHSVAFWASLQRLHDCPENWNARGLSRRGVLERDALLRSWGELDE